MALHVSNHGDIVIVEPHGMLVGGDETEELETRLRELVKAGSHKILLDFAKVTLMTSRPIGILVGVQANAVKHGSALYLCSIDKKIHNLLVILWLIRVLNVLGTRTEALAFLDKLELQVHPDRFQIRAAEVCDMSTTLAYVWENLVGTAGIDRTGSLSAGEATLRIRDAAGIEVYAHGMLEKGAATSATGRPGDWRIEVDLLGFTGDFSARVSRP